MDALTTQQREDCLAYNPFDGDFGEPGDKVLRDRICRARKPAACGECLQPIASGDEQRRHDAIYGGEMRAYRWCSPCCAAMAKFWTDDGEALDARAAIRHQHQGR